MWCLLKSCQTYDPVNDVMKEINTPVQQGKKVREAYRQK